MKAIAPVLALATLVIAPSPALAIPKGHHHGYSKQVEKLIETGSPGTTASNSVPWTGIGIALAIAALAALLLTTLQLTRRTHRTAQ